MRSTLRQFEALRNNVPSSPKEALPFPDDWFDLPAESLADFGAMYYLMSLSPFNNQRSLAQITAQLEPALRLGQYRIFRSNGYPRAFITWAGLDKAAEMGFAVDHRSLKPAEWNSGPSIWLIDFVAPFGQIDQIISTLDRNPDISRLRTLWHNKPATRHRIVEWVRHAPDGQIRMKSFGIGQFKKLLEVG